MIHYVYQGNKITLNWKIKKGVGLALEDFTRSVVKLFLISGDDRFVVPCTASRGVVSAIIEEQLAEGIYSAEVLWVKNGSINHSRCLQRSCVDNLFCITTNTNEADSSQAPVVLNITTKAATYGYDGLSAYEAAVMRGNYDGNESDFYDAIIVSPEDWQQALANKVDKVQGKGLSERDFTAQDKTKLDQLPDNSTLNILLAEKAKASEVYKKTEGKLLPNSYYALNGLLYHRIGVLYYPVAHPDLSTQASRLSFRFGEYNVYEKLYPNPQRITGGGFLLEFEITGEFRLRASSIILQATIISLKKGCCPAIVAKSEAGWVVKALGDIDTAGFTVDYIRVQWADGADDYYYD